MKIFAAAVVIGYLIIQLVQPMRAAAASLDVADGDIREILTLVAAEGGINLVLDTDVQGTISLKLAGLEPQEMIRVICESNQCDYRLQDGIIYVGKANQVKKLHRLKVNYRNLNRAAQMAELFLTKGNLNDESTSAKINDKTDIKRAKNKVEDEAETKSELKRVIVDVDANELIFYAGDGEYRQLKQFMGAIDTAPKQVSLEAKVTAIQKDAEKNLGISWEWSKLPQTPTHSITYDTVQHTIENSDGSISKVTDYIPVDEVTRSWQGGSSAPGVIRFGSGPEGFPYEFYYAAQLNALISEGKANILARPNIMTIQGNEAVINIGSEVPVPTLSTTDAATTTTFEYREAGIILKCTPRVNEDGIITVKVHTEVSSPLYVEDMKAYRFQKRSADTTVRLRDGETMVIGGLIGSDEAKMMSKIPFLGDIPILGNLFKHLKKSKSDTEVMIFLTAREIK